MDPHEMISIPDLLVKAGLARHEGHGWGLVYHGQVKVEQWTLALADGTLPRWVLRGVTIHVGDRSIRISDDGSRILRNREPDSLQLA